jgi:citrate synthase
VASAVDEIKPGLAGVVTDKTEISEVVQETNSLTYRGYAVQDLCANCRFEEVAYLLLKGELPNKAQLDAFTKDERSQRSLPQNVQDLIMASGEAHPMDVLRTAVSMLGVDDPLTPDVSDKAMQAKSVSLLAKIPTVVAMDRRRRHDETPLEPRTDLGLTENFFYMCFGKVPDAATVKAFDISLILYAEHSFNASTFAARVITSTTSDIYSAITGAIGALKGPLHGGANEAVMDMLLEIGDPAKAESWMRDALANKRKIMGFGHRVYRHGDSRVPTMTKAFHEVAAIHKRPDLVQMTDTLANLMIKEKNIYPNLDFPSGPAYYLMGFDTPMFTPIFVISRITGWCAHVMEQQKNNKLIRPLSAYVGPKQRPVPAMERR